MIVNGHQIHWSHPQHTRKTQKYVDDCVNSSASCCFVEEWNHRNEMDEKMKEKKWSITFGFGDGYLERKESFYVWCIFIRVNLLRCLLLCVHSHFGRILQLKYRKMQSEWHQCKCKPAKRSPLSGWLLLLLLLLLLPFCRCRLSRRFFHIFFFIVRVKIHCWNCNQRLIRIFR